MKLNPPKISYLLSYVTGASGPILERITEFVVCVVSVVCAGAVVEDESGDCARPCTATTISKPIARSPARVLSLRASVIRTAVRNPVIFNRNILLHVSSNICSCISFNNQDITFSPHLLRSAQRIYHQTALVRQ